MAIGGSDILGGCRGVGDVASVGGFASRGEVGVNWRGVEFRGLGNGTEITMAQVNGLQHMPERGRSFLSFYLLLHEMAHAGQSCARKPTWPKRVES